MRLSRCLASAARRPVAAVGSRASAIPAATAHRTLSFERQQRRCFSEQPKTQFAEYLERSGAAWAGTAEVQDVASSEDGRSASWRVEIPEEQLTALRRGDVLESRPFMLPGTLAGNRGVRARFQFYPKGDVECNTEGKCSLWLCTDSRVRVPLRLRLGETERESGASEFCNLEDVLRNGAVEVSVSLPETIDAAEPPAAVQQSLRLTGLQVAEWQIYNVTETLRSGELFSSPPFRFHHVLLGDMYLEALPGTPHQAHCTLFFRCRVPTMRLRIGLEVGGLFSKSIEAVGKNTPEDDMKADQCLTVNLAAPMVLNRDGSLSVKCILEEVVTIPPGVRDMIPRLDERALWPKRL